MIGTKDGETFGMEKFADEVSDPIGRDGYIMRRWVKDEGYEILLDIEYLFGMFTVQAEIKNDKPFTVTLTESPEHFAKRQIQDEILTATQKATTKWLSIP